MTTYSRRQFGVLVGLGGLAALTGCASGDPLQKTASPASTAAAPTSAAATASTGGGGTIVVGSQQYYSNEIIAELYAQALEKAGYTVKRQYQIGQREVYLPELEAGKIDVMPEYSGNLLQYYDKAAAAKDAAAIAAALGGKLPKGLRVLKAAEASDQDSYNVTKAFATQHGLASLADLTKAPQPLKVAANSEFATRPYGPKGLKELYGVDVTLTPVEDSGGPLTVRALKDGTVQLADIYTADPSITKEGFVTLADPKNLILPQNVTPLVSSKVDDKAAAAIEGVNAKLSVTALQKLNAQSVDEQKKSADIASAWLKEQGLA